MNNLKLCSSVSKKLVACALLATPLLANAQDPAAVADKVIGKEQTADLSKVEQAIKQQRELEADNLKMSAEKAHKEGDYNQSIEDYVKAIDKYKKVSSSEPRVLNKLKDSENMLSMVYRKQAERLIKKADADLSVKLFEEADAVLLKALEFDPNMDQYVSRKRAEIAEKKLEAERIDAIDARGLAKEAAARKEEKKWRIEQAQIYIANRRFIDAKEVLEEVLVIDPFSSHAATLIRRVNEKLFISGRSRRIATVQERIDEVEWKWSLPIQSDIFGTTDRISDDSKIPISDDATKITEKLKLIIPRFKQNTTNIEDVIEALREEARKQDPDKTGLNIIYRSAQNSAPAGGAPAVPDAPAGGDDPFGDDPFGDPAAEPAAEPGAAADAGAGNDKSYNFDFENMPIGEIIRYICIASNKKYKVDTNAVIIADQNVQIDDMVTRFYPVNSSVFASLQESAPAGGGDLVGGITDVGGGDDEQNVQSYLLAMGVQFPAGAQVAYLPGVSRLVVTNTVTEQRRIQEILNQLQVEAAQVIIESKFVEINQTNLDEFGFQWSLQQTARHNERINFIPNLEGLGVAATAAVAGVDNTQNPVFELVGPNPPIGTLLGFIGDGDFIDQPGGNNLVADVAPVFARPAFPLFTNGNIGGSNIPVVGQNALGGLGSGIRNITALSTPNGNNPGQLSFTSVLGQNQFNTIVRALSQQQNNDVLSAPKVITQNGSTAIIRVVQERYFPESWEPPTVQTVAQGNAGGGGAVLSIQPSLPNFGDPRDLGVVLEVTPQVDPDGVSIEIELKPQVVQFISMDQTFNSPIFVGGFPAVNPITGTPGAATARYDMPILSARSIDTRVKIWDGETVVLGGLVQETAVSVNDRVPILADLPLVGWLFENKGESRTKRNLLIFVSARLVNNAGLPIRENNIRGLPDFKRL